VRALALHTTLRFQREDPRERVGPEGETILTDKWMRGLLREVGAPRKGWKAAAAAIKWLQEYGLIEDTGRVLKPRVPADRLDAGEKFEGSSQELEAGGTRRSTRGTPTGGECSGSCPLLGFFLPTSGCRGPTDTSRNCRIAQRLCRHCFAVKG